MTEAILLVLTSEQKEYLETKLEELTPRKQNLTQPGIPQKAVAHGLGIKMGDYIYPKVEVELYDLIFGYLNYEKQCRCSTQCKDYDKTLCKEAVTLLFKDQDGQDWHLTTQLKSSIRNIYNKRQFRGKVIIKSYKINGKVRALDLEPTPETIEIEVPGEEVKKETFQKLIQIPLKTRIKLLQEIGKKYLKELNQEEAEMLLEKYQATQKEG